jgi:arginyl-tRNA synthetase
MNLPRLLAERLAAAVAATVPDQPEGFAVQVAAAQDTRFGDYQSNAAMLLAKAARANPRELAGRICAAFDGAGLCASPEIAGPGFINFRILPETWGAVVAAALADPACGVAPAAPRRRIVIDFSAPNIAKPMHVGHIRSTIIGDALARIARFLGHEVITDNHIGDWGTQFGMIIHGWKNRLDPAALDHDPITELVRVYKEVNAEAKSDPATLEACRAELVKLQAGDPANLEIWRRCVELSIAGLRRIYARLDVAFDHWLGESFYNDRLAPLVENLLASGLAVESEGAICVFFPGHPQLDDKPCLIRKADGGFLYATTDLATIDYRLETWQADEVWYVVGAPQQLHFQQIFEVEHRRGRQARLVHVAHGSILGQDRKLMKTRSGDNVQLADVLDEAITRAAAIVAEKNPDLPAAEKQSIAEAVGLGAVKFAELSQHRMTDYVFAWDKMLALQGDTAPYLQYSCVRIASIFRKLDGPAPDFSTLAPAALAPSAPEETTLARQLARFAEALPASLDDHRPNLLAAYLLELAGAFHAFFAACPVLKAPEPARSARLALCAAAGRVLGTGLGLLGIRVPDRM